MSDSPTVTRYRARWIVPVAGEPIADGVLEVVDGRIARVGRWRPDDGVCEDWGDVALVPALVNAHTHLEFSTLATPLGTAGMSFAQWIGSVVAWRRSQAGSETEDPRAVGIRESLSCGVALVGEIDTRGTLLPTSPLAAVVFREVLGLRSSLAEERFAWATQFLDVYAGQSAHKPGLIPHAPYTVHPQLFERLVRLASERLLPVAFHLAESQEELQLLSTGQGPMRELLERFDAWEPEAIPAGTRPLDYLRTLATAPRALVVHGNYLEEDELEFVARHAATMTVVYCPRTHAYFGHAPHPLPRLLALGANVAVGTDSRASNPDLSVLGELRHVAHQFPQLSPATVLELGTVRAARALGRSDFGTLEVGSAAHWIAIPVSADCHDPVEAILGGEQMPFGTWLAGQRVAHSHDMPGA